MLNPWCLNAELDQSPGDAQPPPVAARLDAQFVNTAQVSPPIHARRQDEGPDNHAGVRVSDGDRAMAGRSDLLEDGMLALRSSSEGGQAGIGLHALEQR